MLSFVDKMYRVPFFAKLKETGLPLLLFVVCQVLMVSLLLKGYRLDNLHSHQTAMLHGGGLLVGIFGLSMAHIYTIDYRMPWNVSDVLPSFVRFVLLGIQVVFLILLLVVLIAAV